MNKKEFLRLYSQLPKEFQACIKMTIEILSTKTKEQDKTKTTTK